MTVQEDGFEFDHALLHQHLQFPEEQLAVNNPPSSNPKTMAEQVHFRTQLCPNNLSNDYVENRPKKLSKSKTFSKMRRPRGGASRRSKDITNSDSVNRWQEGCDEDEEVVQGCWFRIQDSF